MDVPSIQRRLSSGSTTTPKGVRLAHHQILANTDAIQRHLGVEGGVDRIFAPLPLFHSFGTTVGLWLGQVHDICTIHAPDPRDGKMVGRMVKRHQASFLVSTPTFVRGYMRRVEPEQFASLRFAVVGAEKCPTDLRRQFRDRYQAELLEGYGASVYLEGERVAQATADLPPAARTPPGDARSVAPPTSGAGR